MSKSILVIDTPWNCNECQFSAERLCGKGRCTLNKDCSNEISTNGKPDWCPLRDLPERKEYNNAIPAEKQWCFESISGWNACIDEILKEANGNG